MMKCSVSRWYYKHQIITNSPHQPTQLCLEYRTTVSSNDTTCTGRERHGWPGGRHASPTELKMRSGITTISVNFPTFPAKPSLQLLAKSVRPRAKSFIRPISEIGANAKKCYHWMTSEVRKCPKSAKSDRNSGFLLGTVKRRGVGVWNV